MYVPRIKNLNYQKEQEEKIAGEKNIAKVFNQGENILRYADYTYIVDTEKNSIIRYFEKENVGKQIVYATDDTIGNQLFVMGNKLIFNVAKNTYYSNLDGSDSKKLIDGNIVYMNDEVFVYILQDSSAQYVCITSYNNKNLTRTSDTFNLAKGNEIGYIRECDKYLFFYSNNSNGTTSLFCVDLNNSKSYVLTSLPTEGDDVRYEYTDIAKVGDMVYPLRATYQISRDHETYATNTLYMASIDTIIWENYESDIKARRIFSNDKKLFVKGYDEDSKQYEWLYRTMNEDGDYVVEKTGVLDKNSNEFWTNTLYGDLTYLFTLENGELKMDGMEFADLDDSYKDATLKYAGLFSDKVYFLVNQNGKNIWLRFDSDGSNLKEFYEYTK